jgi:MFS family permease
MQVPSNLLLSSVPRPGIYISCWVLLWGSVSLATGFVHNAAGLIACRFFLGLVEAALFPGSSESRRSLSSLQIADCLSLLTVFIMSSWYKPTELGLRITIVSSLASSERRARPWGKPPCRDFRSPFVCIVLLDERWKHYGTVRDLVTSLNTSC